MRERIQKVLAARGVGSRRQVEAWIAAGRITVNGKLAVTGQPVGDRDDVRLDGRRLRLARGSDAPHQGIAYHRPAQEGIRSAGAALAPASLERLPKAGGRRWIPVSPLAPRDGGLELFVTDGELAAALTRRGNAISSGFSVRVRGPFDDAAIERQMRERAETEGMKGEVKSVTAAGGEASNRWLQVEVAGLRPRDLRAILLACGVEANRILRTRYGPIAMDRALARGRHRALTEGELKALRDISRTRPTGSRSPGR
ncbi:MAG: S4 domain-containing protein [Steroidobacteraceae bacterium]